MYVFLIFLILSYLIQAGVYEPVKPREVVCPAVYQPVCGEDGNTYSNSCETNAAGVKIAYRGECNDPKGPFDGCMFGCDYNNSNATNIIGEIPFNMEKLKYFYVAVFLKDNIVVDFNIYNIRSSRCIKHNYADEVMILALNKKVIIKKLDDKCLKYDGEQLLELNCSNCKSNYSCSNCEHKAEAVERSVENPPSIVNLTYETESIRSNLKKYDRVEIDVKTGKKYGISRKPIKLLFIELPFYVEEKETID